MEQRNGVAKCLGKTLGPRESMEMKREKRQIEARS